MLTLTKRRHKFYTKEQRREAVKDAQRYGLKYSALVADIPQSTIRTWLKQEKQKRRPILKILLWLGEFVTLSVVGLILMGLIALGICYLFGGKDEVLFIRDLFYGLNY